MFLETLSVLTIVFSVTLPARAQGPFGVHSEPPEKLVTDTLRTPYADALLKRFAAAVRKDGDGACLQAKALDEAALIASGRAMLQRYGMQTIVSACDHGHPALRASWSR
jgi:hypothetical protein